MEVGVFGYIDGAVERVGTIKTLPAYEEQFTYAESFMAAHPQSRLSLSLPQQEEPFVSRQTRPYFKNLLPEGAALDAVARQLEVSSTSYLQILGKLGDECIGAVVIGGSGEPDPSGYLRITRDELAAFALREADGMAQLQAASRLSLAGAQSKMGVRARLGDSGFEYLLPHGSAASTHILKTANRRFEQLSENEHCCMRLAAACGIRVPRTHVDVVREGIPLFLAERYDRVVDGEPETVRRLHQEDFCQALGLLPERKYERPGGSHLKSCADLIARNSARPAEDLRQLVALMAFNVMVGNCDAHLKNLSLLCDESWSRRILAPAYDLVSTVVYEGLDRHFSMRVGSASKVDEIRRADFGEAAGEVSMTRRAVLAIVDDVVGAVAQELPGVIEETEDVLRRKLGKLEAIREYSMRKSRDLSTGL